jgi:glucose/arabinose dehydrogenase
VAFKVVPVADGLQNPWGLAFLPDGRMLVTERPGRLRIVAADGTKSEPLAGLPPVDARGQGGLLDGRAMAPTTPPSPAARSSTARHRASTTCR